MWRLDFWRESGIKRRKKKSLLNEQIICFIFQFMSAFFQF